MLTVTIPPVDQFNNETSEFVRVHDGATIELEHSLVSLAKWESKWKKSFLSSDSKTTEETFSYLEIMCLTPEIPPAIFRHMPNSVMAEINAYIEDKMTATFFTELGEKKGNREIITNEIIYNWMIALNIPLEWENRHLNKLFTLLRVVNTKNQPEKKMTRQQILARNRQLNNERRAQHNTAG